MNYIFMGNLRGFYCGECFDYLYKAKVRIYMADRESENIIEYAVAKEKETFHQRSKAELKSLAKRLLIETETDEMGNFTIEFPQNYDGHAFDIDFECGSVPVILKVKTPPKPRGPFQFHITTLQPRWKEMPEKKQTYTAYWEYGITNKFWCWLLRLFGLYVICGRVLDCEKKIPISGLNVKAFDVDLIQDDYLGQGTTNVNGEFKIYYTEADFTKTIFPGINIEWIPGPDIYFLIESGSGTVIMQEPRNRGRQKDRENVSNCFCVELCVPVTEQPPIPVPIPAFLNVGGINYTTNIHSSPSADGLTTSNYAFYKTLRLNGILSQTFGGQPMEYCFEFTKDFDAAGAPINWQRINAGQIRKTHIGYVEKAIKVNFPFPHYVYHNTNCYVDYVTTAGEITSIPNANGWILVPQQKDNPLNAAGVGLFVANGNQILLDSKSLAAFPDIDLTGLVAGQDTKSTGKPLAEDKIFALRMLVREQGNNATITEAGMCGRIAIDNTKYTNMKHHPEWGAWDSSTDGEYGVCMVDVQQLIAGGCNKITNKVDVLYSVAHPNIKSIGMTLKGPMPEINLGPIPVTQNSFGTVTHYFAATDPPCAYLITLSAKYLLTTGDKDLDPVYDQIAFCR